MIRENVLSGIVIGEAIKVHRELGPGLLEPVYEECLTYHLLKLNLMVECQKPIPLIYNEINLPCTFRCDLMIEKKLIVEIKAIELLNDIHLAQVLTYLKLTGTKLALLINFNVLKLIEGVKRVVNKL